MVSREVKNAVTITPVSKRDIISEPAPFAIRRTERKAIKAKMKDESSTGKPLPKKTIERDAPKAAPEEIPRIYSFTRGFLKGPEGRLRRLKGKLQLLEQELPLEVLSLKLCPCKPLEFLLNRMMKK